MEQQTVPIGRADLRDPAVAQRGPGRLLGILTLPWKAMSSRSGYAVSRAGCPRVEVP